MDNFIPYIIAAVIVLGVIVLLIQFASRSGKTKDTNNQKNTTKAVRDAARKLKQNPHNISALTTLSDYYYNDHKFDKAFQLYDTLLDIASRHSNINEFKVALRQGICAVKLNRVQDAFKGLAIAYKIKPVDYDVCFYTGLAFYLNETFDKAIPYLRKAAVLRPDSTEVSGPLGSCLYKTGKFKESLTYTRKYLTDHPNDKEMLFDFADTMYQSGFGDKAVKIFMRLRPDPKYGPKACLTVGTIHMNNKLYDKAIEDFEIGIKLIDVPLDIMVETRYKMATCYLAMNQISKGLEQLKKIQTLVPSYKDVSALIARYAELNQNTNLRLYLSSGANDFVALCRNIVLAFYSKSFVKIINVTMSSDNCEILCNVESTKWEDNELFRFYRTTGMTGELYVRDFHAKIKDEKADRGICFTAGHFSEEGHKYIEGRPIDLYEKEQLIKILKKISVPQTAK